MTKQYKFKIFFNEIACYREISVNADTDEQARDLYAKEFHKDPFVYPFADDMHNLPQKIYRATYEIEGEKKRWTIKRKLKHTSRTSRKN
jgi:hypothetical protein